MVPVALPLSNKHNRLNPKTLGFIFSDLWKEKPPSWSSSRRENNGQIWQFYFYFVPGTFYVCAFNAQKTLCSLVGSQHFWYPHFTGGQEEAQGLAEKGRAGL